jgi:hypothetical protein
MDLLFTGCFTYGNKYWIPATLRTPGAPIEPSNGKGIPPTKLAVHWVRCKTSRSEIYYIVPSPKICIQRKYIGMNLANEMSSHSVLCLISSRWTYTTLCLVGTRAIAQHVENHV